MLLNQFKLSTNKLSILTAMILSMSLSTNTFALEVIDDLKKQFPISIPEFPWTKEKTKSEDPDKPNRPTELSEVDITEINIEEELKQIEKGFIDLYPLVLEAYHMIEASNKAVVVSSAFLTSVSSSVGIYEQANQALSDTVNDPSFKNNLINTLGNPVADYQLYSNTFTAYLSDITRDRIKPGDEHIEENIKLMKERAENLIESNKTNTDDSKDREKQYDVYVKGIDKTQTSVKAKISLLNKNLDIAIKNNKKVKDTISSQVILPIQEQYYTAGSILTQTGKLMGDKVLKLQNQTIKLRRQTEEKMLKDIGNALLRSKAHYDHIKNIQGAGIMKLIKKWKKIKAVLDLARNFISFLQVAQKFYQSSDDLRIMNRGIIKATELTKKVSPLINESTQDIEKLLKDIYQS